MELTPLVEILRQFGPTGLTIIMMGGGLVYLTRWLRTMADKHDERYDKSQERFIVALNQQRQEFKASLQEVVTEFKGMHEELGEKVDRLSQRVDALRGSK